MEGPPTSQEEKNYWKYWEPACPYVRGTDCCKWVGDGSGTTENTCCGDNPYESRCGDGTMDKSLGETCDDGNILDGDGCSSTCQDESPTSAPAAPAEENQEQPVPSPSPVCAGSDEPLVTLLYQSTSSESPPADLIRVLKTDYSSEGVPMVQFEIKNTFAENMDKFFVQFHEQVVGAAYNFDCFGANNIPIDTVMAGAPFEAVCLSQTGSAIVDLWVVNNGVVVGATEKVPDCCHGDQADAVHYKFHVLCACPKEIAAENRGLLRGAANKFR
jgi:cysteine-rich repeat protein